MSAFHRPTPLMTGVSSSCRQTSEPLKVCLSPPRSLSSPVIRKKAIQISSFDEKGLISETHSSKPSAVDISLDLVSSKTSGQLWWSKACQRKHREGVSSPPRTNSKALRSQTFSAKPDICISPAPEPNPPPAILTLKSKPSDSLLLHASQLSNFYPIQLQPDPKPSMSPALTVPVPRRSPSPSPHSQNFSTSQQNERQPSPVAKERRARSISISNTKITTSDQEKHEVLDQRALMDFTHPGLRRVGQTREFKYQTESFRLPAVPQISCSQQKKIKPDTNENTPENKPRSPHRNFNLMNNPEPDIKRQQRKESVDILIASPNLQRKSADSQSSHLTSIHRSLEQMHSGKISPVPVVSNASCSTEPLSVKSETRGRRFDLHKEVSEDKTLPSGSFYKRPQEESRQAFLGSSCKFLQQAGSSQNITPPKRCRFPSKPQSQAAWIGAKSEASRSNCVSEDLRCQSTPFHQTAGALEYVGLNRAKTPHTHQTAERHFLLMGPNKGLNQEKSVMQQESSKLGSGIGGGGISAAPPSGIPVPIGSHGPSHVSSHTVVHSGGHVGAHPPAHSAGHGHGGSHSSSGGSTLLGYIGIDTIIEQMRKKTMKTGFDFNIMVVGPSGLGKSTLVNTLFKSQVSRKSAGWARDEKIPKTVEIKSVSHVIEEGGVKMKLTIVDTPGFGDQINNDNCWEPISKYINEQFEKFLKEEVNITRKKRIPDTRVHCCLYFIPPTGHCLRQLDVEFMRRLSHSVNIIPVIAKSDTMTIEERQEFKQRVRKELENNGIEFYPQKEFDDDMEDKSDNDKIRETMPFAVVGSDKEHQVNGKRVLGRKTAWGIIEVENPNHCEFAQLRDFLIRSHLQDLKEVTHNIHYETYRAKRLNDNGGLHPISSNDTQESNL
uniref:Neuronal-specific septin-3 n=2 Tax=Nothobranchius korthausae TaxID=1143690 RepID=A0A1A8FTI9_9TELE